MKISVKELRLKNAEKEAEKVVHETENELSDLRLKWIELMFVCILCTVSVIFIGILPPFPAFGFWFIVILCEIFASINIYYWFEEDIDSVLYNQFESLMKIAKKYHLDNSGKRKILDNEANSLKFKKSFNIVFSIEIILIIVTAVLCYISIL